MKKTHPNVVIVFGDQWRQQATGFAGDPNLAGQTPHLDALAAESVQFTNAVAGCPVCTPYRASLLTGLYPHHHGLFLNDLQLEPQGPVLGQTFRDAGYDTAYIGKWHVDGHGRAGFIPRERRCGFDFWEVLECTHDYNNSYYWGNDDKPRRWDGYDAIDQTRHACRYVRDHADGDRPFMLVLSWGTPHNPYQTAPEEYRRRFNPDDIQLRPNVPGDSAEPARKDLAGYYAHIAAMDDCVGQVLQTLDETGVAEETILLVTSDHGDMLGSHGSQRKQQPWDESIRVPFLLRVPQLGAAGHGERDELIDAPDIMPTLLGLAGLPVPEGLDGLDFSPAIRGESEVGNGAASLACYSPFGEWTRSNGGREFRGLRTARYTYTRTLDGPWLLFDNRADPYQQNNLIDVPECAELQTRLDAQLNKRLKAAGDDFTTGPELINRWSYRDRYDWTDRDTVDFQKRYPSPPWPHEA
jgi:arylsulfatase A-like enzyme